MPVNKCRRNDRSWKHNFTKPNEIMDLGKIYILGEWLKNFFNLVAKNNNHVLFFITLWVSLLVLMCGAALLVSVFSWWLTWGRWVSGGLTHMSGSWQGWLDGWGLSLYCSQEGLGWLYSHLWDLSWKSSGHCPWGNLSCCRTVQASLHGSLKGSAAKGGNHWYANNLQASVCITFTSIWLTQAQTQAVK